MNSPRVTIAPTTIRRLMRQHRVTVAQVAAFWAFAGITQARVRAVRRLGGAFDWPQMIAQAATGVRS